MKFEEINEWEKEHKEKRKDQIKKISKQINRVFTLLDLYEEKLKEFNSTIKEQGGNFLFRDTQTRTNVEQYRLIIQKEMKKLSDLSYFKNKGDE
jgi:predicted ATP-dependent Lon-type protease